MCAILENNDKLSLAVQVIKAKHPEEETVEEVKEAKTEEQRLKELNTVLTRLDTQRVVSLLLLEDMNFLFAPHNFSAGRRLFMLTPHFFFR